MADDRELVRAELIRKLEWQLKGETHTVNRLLIEATLFLLRPPETLALTEPEWIENLQRILKEDGGTVT